MHRECSGGGGRGRGDDGRGRCLSIGAVTIFRKKASAVRIGRRAATVRDTVTSAVFEFLHAYIEEEADILIINIYKELRTVSTRIIVFV